MRQDRRSTDPSCPADSYSGVRAYWTHKAGADRKSVLVGHSGNAKRLRETFATEAEARKHPAAHPEVIVTSSEKGMGIAELRTAVLEAVES